MRKVISLVMSWIIAVSLTACGDQRELVDMESTIVDDKLCIIWEDRTYSPFCVVSKKDCGGQIGYVDGDTNDRISEYKGYSSDEWIVSWLPEDGGAILLKEENVVEIPEGLEAEYPS